jgi:RNA ligase
VIEKVSVAIGQEYNIRNVAEAIRGMENSEGIVVRFEDGHMVKVKSEWYLQLHHAKDVMNREKNVLALVLEDKLDDLLPIVPEDYVPILNQYREDVQKGLDETAGMIEQLYSAIMANMKSKEKREFAVHWVKKCDKRYHGFLFALWDKKDVRGALKEKLLQSCHSINHVENSRWMMNDAKYEIPVGTTITDEEGDDE